jgi:hypothetical protein
MWHLADLSGKVGQIILLKKIVTSIEKWCFKYDSQVKCLICLWEIATLPKPKKTHSSKTEMKNNLFHLFSIGPELIPESLLGENSDSCKLYFAVNWPDKNT